MARTTDTAVGELLEEIPTVPLTPFIEAANVIVTQHCAPDTDYTITDLELIERWLSAHFFGIREVRAMSEGVKGISEHKAMKIDLGFDLTMYGQMAKRLDYKGYLAALDERSKKGTTSAGTISWLGTEA